MADSGLPAPRSHGCALRLGRQLLTDVPGHGTSAAQQHLVSACLKMSYSQDCGRLLLFLTLEARQAIIAKENLKNS